MINCLERTVRLNFRGLLHSIKRQENFLILCLGKAINLGAEGGKHVRGTRVQSYLLYRRINIFFFILLEISFTFVAYGQEWKRKVHNICCIVQ